MPNFLTYKATKYAAYLVDYDQQLNAIYEVIAEIPTSQTYKAKLLGLSYHAYWDRIKKKSLTHEQLLKLLQFVAQ